MSDRVKSIALALSAVMTFLLIWAGYTQAWTGFGGKTLWDWMELLIVPAVLAGGALWFNQQEREAERKTSQERDRIERELAADRDRGRTLEVYLDKMTELILDRGLRPSADAATNSDAFETARDIARVRTFTVLRVLDGKRNREVLRFLVDAGLVSWRGGEAVISLSGPDVDLRGADFRCTDLRDADFSEADLSEVDFRGADLRGASLRGANLSKADLREAFLWENTDLHGADLRQVNLHGALGVFPTAFAEAGSMRGATWVNGKAYDGRYNLENDLGEARSGDRFIWPDIWREDKERKPINIDNPEEMARFYGIQMEDYRIGQEWARENLLNKRIPAEN